MQFTTIPQRQTILRRMGTTAFLFFLVKGLMWLAAPFLFMWIA